MPIIIAIVAAIVLVGAGVYFFSGNTPETEPTISIEETMNEPVTVPTEPAAPTEPVVTETEPSREATEETPVASTGGTFTASASYLTPARTSHDIDVTLTVDATGIITAAEVVYDKGEGFSNGHQERFDGAYRAAVIGQSIDTVSLSRVGGASLTSKGFNDAIAQIRAERG
jgi:hypothetical protein